ncbi:acyl-protein synthetase [Stenomitos frigidus ULC18]|uniref:Acyl-protein synthetase n=1 Tax=Stenomitos frigidus ULC18 TaxID=2107698 RepID=A0A2T1DZ48_9CYAN|nr:acyl-protein synthetase [Stenomitos frigidus ULC18]
MRSIEQLTEELLALPHASRTLLAEKLVGSLEFDTDSGVHNQENSLVLERGNLSPLPGDCSESTTIRRS